MALSDFEWLSKIFDDTKRRTLSLRQLSFLFHTPFHSMPPLWPPVGILPSRLVWRKLEWWSYPIVKNCWGYIIKKYNRLARIPACARQTDRHTDRQTNILPHRVVRAMPTRRAVKMSKQLTTKCMLVTKFTIFWQQNLLESNGLLTINFSAFLTQTIFTN